MRSAIEPYRNRHADRICDSVPDHYLQPGAALTFAKRWFDGSLLSHVKQRISYFGHDSEQMHCPRPRIWALSDPRAVCAHGSLEGDHACYGDAKEMVDLSEDKEDGRYGDAVIVRQHVDGPAVKH